MRRILLVSACLGVLVFAGASTALARGPHHRPHHARYGYDRPAYGGGWYGGYGGHRRGYRPYCRPHRRYAASRAYPGPYYGAYPGAGFGVGGRNFSFWFQR